MLGILIVFFSFSLNRARQDSVSDLQMVLCFTQSLIIWSKVDSVSDLQLVLCFSQFFRTF